jgi:hypothetical protein
MSLSTMTGHRTARRKPGEWRGLLRPAEVRGLFPKIPLARNVHRNTEALRRGARAARKAVECRRVLPGESAQRLPAGAVEVGRSGDARMVRKMVAETVRRLANPATKRTPKLAARTLYGHEWLRKKRRDRRRRQLAIGLAAIPDAVDGDSVLRLFEDHAVVADPETEQPFQLSAERFDSAVAGGR